VFRRLNDAIIDVSPNKPKSSQSLGKKEQGNLHVKTTPSQDSDRSQQAWQLACVVRRDGGRCNKRAEVEGSAGKESLAEATGRFRVAKASDSGWPKGQSAIRQQPRKSKYLIRIIIQPYSPLVVMHPDKARN
jgi:hypothetical protein